MSNEIICETVFSPDFFQIFDASVTPLLLEANTTDDNEAQDKSNTIYWTPKNFEHNLACSYCRVTFPNVSQQREHYRLDWHRYNLKLSLQSKAPIAEAEFAKKTENDDVSSISGSDTEEDEQDNLNTYATAQGKLFLQNEKGQVFSIYRCLLLDKKEEPGNTNLYKRYRANCYDNKQWTILMLGGGHFAGAVFNYYTPLLHKTFHCYTVRAGQGGSQSSKDNKSGSTHSKSAGSSLRRYNEQALIDHVRNTISLWSEEIKKSSIIFYRASGPYNRLILFGGKEPLLDRNSEKLRTIPFSTGRATYGEVKRVHLLLASSEVYESVTQATNKLSKQISPESTNKRNKLRGSCINRAKSRETLERPLPGEMPDANSLEIDPTEMESLEIADLDLNSENIEISFQNLKEFGDSLTPEQRKRGQNNRKKPRKSKNQKLKEKEEARKRELIDTLIKGNLINLRELLDKQVNIFKENTNVSKAEIASDFFNEILDENGNSFLHITAMNEHEEVLQYLLENEANPCLKNKFQQTPYSCTNSKSTRDIFRKFARDNPDKYNYNKAQIPLNVLTDEELAENKRAHRKVKREKEKEKKKENQIQQKEENEKDRFLKLSDREKRALAAERRIINAAGKVIARCFLCGSDMAGKVPFEYLENRFCSIECLKSHRLKATVAI